MAPINAIMTFGASSSMVLDKLNMIAVRAISSFQHETIHAVHHVCNHANLKLLLERDATSVVMQLSIISHASVESCVVHGRQNLILGCGRKDLDCSARN